MTTREPNIGKLENELQQWGKELDKLVLKAEKVGTQAKVDYHARINDLKTKRNAAQLKLNEFKNAGNETWDSFKDGIEKAWTELETAFKEPIHKSKTNEKS